MSIEFFIYAAPASIPKRSDLARALKKDGWSILFMDADSKELPDGLLEDELIWATPNARDLKKLKALLNPVRRNEIESLFESEHAAGCTLGVTAGIDAEEIEGLPAKLKKQLKKQKWRFDVRTSAGRSELSYELQETVWATLGEMVGGILEDPQQGRFIRIHDGTEVVLHESSPGTSEDSTVVQFMEFMKAAKAAGFPVGMTGDDVDLGGGRLSPSQLEQFLQFTLKHFPEIVPGKSISRAILEDYRKNQGSTLDPIWFQNLETKYAHPF